MKQDLLTGKPCTARVISTLLVIFTMLSVSCSPVAQVPGASLVNTPASQPETPLPPSKSARQRGTATADPTLPAAPTDLPVYPRSRNGRVVSFPDNVNPLTGLVVDDPSRLERRPVMVKVSNFPRTGRPHAGLSFADIVFEYYIGYGLNRFMGIYLGQDSSQVRAGPLRPPGRCAAG